MHTLINKIVDMAVALPLTDLNSATTVEDLLIRKLWLVTKIYARRFSLRNVKSSTQENNEWWIEIKLRWLVEETRSINELSRPSLINQYLNGRLNHISSGP